VPVAIGPGWDLVDPFALGLLFLGIVIFVAIVALSHEHERAWSATVVYLLLGLLTAAGMSLIDVTPLDPLGDGDLVVERLTEVALVVAIFGAGLSVESISRRKWANVAVLLGVVMPLTIAAIALFGVYAMGLSAGAAIMLGAILAPTDPVLAGDVGLGRPGEHADSSEPRFSLHTEAGMNDGLASPFIVLGIVVAAYGGDVGRIAEWFAIDVVYAIGIAAVAGGALGYATAAATVRLRAREFLLADLDQYVGLAAALLAYGAAEVIGGYGFLAVFAAGFGFRRYEFGHEVNRRVHDGTEDYGKLFELLVILLLGSLVTFDRLGEPGLAGWLLAPLLIVVLRPALVVPLAGRTLMTAKERLFLGWFGVRGVAALFYAAFVVHEGVLSADEEATVFWTAAAVVMVSIVVHGTSASPLGRRWLDPRT
jgi:NhaP-type Na+/H+ or K+/H+ antiporter